MLLTLAWETTFRFPPYLSCSAISAAGRAGVGCCQRGNLLRRHRNRHLHLFDDLLGDDLFDRYFLDDLLGDDLFDRYFLLPYDLFLDFYGDDLLDRHLFDYLDLFDDLFLNLDDLRLGRLRTAAGRCQTQQKQP